MNHYKKIYTSQAQKYHQMIAVEDVDGNLLSVLQQIVPQNHARLLDLGSGTGRIALLMHKMVRQVIALDLNEAMLLEQRKQQQNIDGCWPIIQGDNRHLPFADNWANVVTAGWAIGHLRGWYAEDWQRQIGMILKDMERVVLPGGSLVIIETLTTGALEPTPPTPRLAEYYGWLEETWGYKRKTIQTDYQFASVDEAVSKTEFFFGPDLAELIRQNQWSRLPEWTGIWSKQE